MPALVARCRRLVRARRFLSLRAISAPSPTASRRGGGRPHLVGGLSSAAGRTTELRLSFVSAGDCRHSVDIVILLDSRSIPQNRLAGLPSAGSSLVRRHPGRGGLARVSLVEWRALGEHWGWIHPNALAGRTCAHRLNARSWSAAAPVSAWGLHGRERARRRQARAAIPFLTCACSQPICAPDVATMLAQNLILMALLHRAAVPADTSKGSMRSKPRSHAAPSAGLFASAIAGSALVHGALSPP